jgi:hypothetical protein
MAKRGGREKPNISHVTRRATAVDVDGTRAVWTFSEFETDRPLSILRRAPAPAAAPGG